MKEGVEKEHIYETPKTQKRIDKGSHPPGFSSHTKMDGKQYERETTNKETIDLEFLYM